DDRTVQVGARVDVGYLGHVDAYTRAQAQVEAQIARPRARLLHERGDDERALAEHARIELEAPRRVVVGAGGRVGRVGFVADVDRRDRAIVDPHRDRVVVEHVEGRGEHVSVDL